MEVERLAVVLCHLLQAFISFCQVLLVLTEITDKLRVENLKEYYFMIWRYY